MGTSIGYSPPSSSSGGSGSGNATTDIGRNANFRNRDDTQTAVKDRVPLKIDALRTQGAFNRLFDGLWNPETSRIHPSNMTQCFDGRIIVEATPTVAGSIITFDLDVRAEGSNTPILIYNDPLPLFRLEKTTFTRPFTFFTSQVLLDNGGQLNVRCTEPVKITNASLYLILKGGSV